MQKRSVMISINLFFKVGHSRHLFLYICIIYLNVKVGDKICRCWDSNCGCLVLDETLYQLSHHHCPLTSCYWWKFVGIGWHRLALAIMVTDLLDRLKILTKGAKIGFDFWWPVWLNNRISYNLKNSISLSIKLKNAQIY